MSVAKGGIIMKKAIIYVRGHNQERQEVTCKLYAAEQGYKVLFTTDDLEKVNACDILLISKASRISRDKFKYYEVLNELKTKGIKVESVAQQKSSIDYFTFA